MGASSTEFDAEYGADQIQILEGLEAVRKRPGMYIGSTSTRGLHHLVYEIVDNSVDEALAGYCDEIQVNINKDNSVTVCDNGRGIPVGINHKAGLPAVEVVFTVLHAGGKFGGGGYKVSGGLHGVGASVVNALSEWLEVEIYHDGQIYKQRYERGKVVYKLKVVGECEPDRTGTTVTFFPDAEIFDDTVFDYDTLKQRFREMAFLTKGLKIVLRDWRGEELREHTFHYEGGIKEFVTYLNKSKTPLYEQIIYCEGMKDGVAVEIAMQHNDSYSENTYGFVNNITTPEGGTHIEGFRGALTKTFNDYARKNKLLKDSEPNLSGDDIREGLTAIVSVKIEDPQFEGQTKQKLGNSEARGAVMSVVASQLEIFLEQNPSVGKMIVENYSAAGKKTGSKTVAMELSLFGGFYSGSDHNYFVFGQANPNDSDEEEVMRIVKYSKDFQRIGAVSVYGANTNIPFEAGSLRMTETAGKLYIHTCHEMYTDSDGLNHQANMTFVINENDMSVEQSYYDVLNLAQAGYVSHSFNQFIQTDGENIYRVDHGDYAPRGIALIKSQVGGSITKVDYAIPVGLGKVTGGHYNSTGASVGGFEISSENCIIAGNAVDFESESANTSDQRNIFISITDKQLTQAKTVWLTNYDKQQGINVQTPQLVKIGEDQFLVMWQEGSKSEGNLTTKIVTIDSEGNKTSNIRSKSMPLSDCQPVVGPDGVVRWYVTDGKAPTIYAVNPFEQSQSYIKGDVNEDGKVEISDLRLILRSVCKKVELTEQQKLAADVTEDGKVEIGDLRKVLRYICHKIPEL